MPYSAAQCSLHASSCHSPFLIKSETPKTHRNGGPVSAGHRNHCDFYHHPSRHGIISMYLNVSQCISIIITIHHHVLSPHRPNFFPMRNCLPQVVGACNQSNYIRPWGVIFLGESHHFRHRDQKPSFTPSTNLAHLSMNCFWAMAAFSLIFRSMALMARADAGTGSYAP